MFAAAGAFEMSQHADAEFNIAGVPFSVPKFARSERMASAPDLLEV
jgi:hypothetical protein